MTRPPRPARTPVRHDPDIVVIVLDDVPQLDGRFWTRMPHIERLFVEQGVEFVDAHGETPTCAPGRAGFLTGLHTQHHGSYTTDGSLLDSRETIATELQSVGYHTIQVGKYTNLFERVYPKWPPGWDEFHGYGGDYFDYTMWSNGVPHHYGSRPSDYSTDVIAKLAVGSLGRAPKDKPLFAWITPFNTHLPRTLAPRFRTAKGCALPRWRPANYMERDVRDKPAYIQRLKVRDRAGYQLQRLCRGLRSADDLVSRVVRQLRRLDRLDNTLLILTSDNGMTYGAHRIRDDKKSPYASQIPFYATWPRVLGRQPRKESERIQNIDLAATLCDIAGCEMGPYPTGQSQDDGRSFLSILTGERSTLTRQAVLTSYQDEDWLPRYWSVTTTGASPLAHTGCRARREGGCRWTYTEYETGEKELYDISNGPCSAWHKGKRGDPCMLTNKANKPNFRTIQSELREELARLKR